jgi:hypothetical protein
MGKNLLYATSMLIALLSPAIYAADNRSVTSEFGEAITPVDGARTIAIKPDTTWVEVRDGEIVKFMMNGQTFAWHFNGINTLSEIDLNKIAPNGTLDHLVKVYIDRKWDGY